MLLLWWASYISYILFIGALDPVTEENWKITTDEISRGVAMHPSSSWGNRMRDESSIRILAIGGSNTYGTGYVEDLERYLQNNVSKNSSCLNVGKSGTPPEAFIGVKFKFEDYYNQQDQWPNLILLEFTVNSGMRPNTWDVYDKLVRSLLLKWIHRGFQTPDILILELFTVEWLQHESSQWQNKTSRIEQINSISNMRGDFHPAGSIGFNRGCIVCLCRLPAVCCTEYGLCRRNPNLWGQ